jgi:hypothetical protein
MPVCVAGVQSGSYGRDSTVLYPAFFLSLPRDDMKKLQSIIMFLNQPPFSDLANWNVCRCRRGYGHWLIMIISTLSIVFWYL